MSNITFRSFVYLSYVLIVTYKLIKKRCLSEIIEIGLVHTLHISITHGKYCFNMNLQAGFVSL